jgi:outer membrane protein assembly factor BamA
MYRRTDFNAHPFYAALALVVLVCSMLGGCTATKFLKEGETFYNGPEFQFETPDGPVRRKKILASELETYVNPKPNPKVLGSRPAVWFYFIAGTPKKKKGGLRNFIKNKLGQPPVLLKEATPDRTARLLEGQVNNEGYFRSKVKAEVVTKRKDSKVVYHITLNRPYRLRNIDYPNPKDSTYAAIIRTLKEESILDSNQRYDLEKLQAEQERIEREVENFGLYYFDDRYLLFEADSTVGKRRVDLTLKLEKDIPARARKIYRLDTINIFPNYFLTTDSTKTATPDTTIVDKYRYIDDKNNFRPQVITRVINLKRGERFNREAQELSLSHLMGLGVFKFVNIKFSESPRTDSAMLNTDILLTPLKKKSLRLEVQGVSKSNNFVGPGVSLSFTNRNAFRGAELLQIRLHGAYEWQISRKVAGGLNSIETGLEASLTVPRFMTPIKIDFSSSRYLPKTTFKAGINLQNRVSYYRLNSFNVGYGYNWRESPSKSHELYPVDISFVRTDKRSQAFQDLLKLNPVLENSFEDQFIVGTRYSFTLNTQLSESAAEKYEEKKTREHNFYFNGTIDVAGNLLHGIQQISKVQEGDSVFTLFNSPYSQYVRGEADFRYYWTFDTKNKIAVRLAAATGYAFGNSTTLPYIKQFAIGGSNSIRAFPARSVGPGGYNVLDDEKAASDDNARLFIDQRGDIKLEGNAEYRFDIYKALKGALFVDAGNIWLYKADPTRTGQYDPNGGKFDRKTFLNQLAVGTGAGLRFDFSFFVLRLDVAFPLRRNDTGWVARDIDLGSSEWRKRNLVFNIAIGYPF